MLELYTHNIVLAFFTILYMYNDIHICFSNFFQKTNFFATLLVLLKAVATILIMQFSHYAQASKSIVEEVAKSDKTLLNS